MTRTRRWEAESDECTDLGSSQREPIGESTLLCGVSARVKPVNGTRRTIVDLLQSDNRLRR